MSPLILRADGDELVLDAKTAIGSYAEVARLDVLQAANLAADIDAWLQGALEATVSVQPRFL